MLVFSQDGNSEEIRQLIGSITFAPVVHLKHSPPLLGRLVGLFARTDAPTAANVFFLLRFAFNYMRAPAAIVLESDLELSVDGYEYFKWAYRQIADARAAADDAKDAAEAAAAQRGGGSGSGNGNKPTADDILAHVAPEMRSSDAFCVRDAVFTINGFTEHSDASADLFAFDTREHKRGFAVWGWLCPHWTWPALEQGWTWFHNWDITVEERIRQRASAGSGLGGSVSGSDSGSGPEAGAGAAGAGSQLGVFSLSPLVSRTRNIGMQGINFNVVDEKERAKWENLHTPQSPVDYSRQRLKLQPRPARC